MGMSTHVVGFKPSGEKWRAMKAVWDACLGAGIPAPKEVTQFFGGADPEPAGVEVRQKELMDCGAARRWVEGERDGFEVDVGKLPPDVKIIRFWNSY